MKASKKHMQSIHYLNIRLLTPPGIFVEQSEYSSFDMTIMYMLLLIITKQKYLIKAKVINAYASIVRFQAGLNFFSTGTLTFKLIDSSINLFLQLQKTTKVNQPRKENNQKPSSIVQNISEQLLSVVHYQILCMETCFPKKQ